MLKFDDMVTLLLDVELVVLDTKISFLLSNLTLPLLALRDTKTVVDLLMVKGLNFYSKIRL